MNATLRDQVLASIKRSLPRKPLVSEIAKSLGFDSGNLALQLSREGTCFRELTQLARREAFPALLANQELTIRDIALSLGFWDPNAFYRAFRDWEGMTPKQWLERNVHGNTKPDGKPRKQPNRFQPPSERARKAANMRLQLQIAVVRHVAEQTASVPRNSDTLAQLPGSPTE